MKRLHLRDVPIARLGEVLAAAGAPRPQALQRQLALAMHRRHALDWQELGVGKRKEAFLRARFRFGPLLTPQGERTADDGARKFVFGVDGGASIEVVLIPNRASRTLCLSSQAGCALGCTFCATGKLGLLRNLTAGEILESAARVQRASAERITDVVFMGMGEPLHNYQPVLDACDTLNHHLGPTIGRKHITVSTAGLTPAIRRFTRERRRFRLHLSLHSAVDRTREQIMPIARVHPLADVLAAFRELQRELERPWLTFQYVALPGVNMDEEHVEALAQRLQGIRYILNVIPWNDVGGNFSVPTWSQVKDFTTRLRRLECPVKVRYSAGKQEGMGCGQLSAETVRVAADVGHMAAPPGIFTG